MKTPRKIPIQKTPWKSYEFQWEKPTKKNGIRRLMANLRVSHMDFGISTGI